MSEFVVRNATIQDVPFLVETIIEAEKSGTDKLSYSTVFGLSEAKSRKYISDMLLEEIDGCELSISSFLIAEKDGQYAGAASAWIEGVEGIPSAILKGNLLNYTLPKECIEKAVSINSIISELHIDFLSNTMQFGAAYVPKKFRGNNLLALMKTEIIKRLLKSNPNVSEAYVQFYESNIPAIKVNKKLNFKMVMTKKSSNEEILNYLPSNKMILMKKEL